MSDIGGVGPDPHHPTPLLLGGIPPGWGRKKTSGPRPFAPIAKKDFVLPVGC